MESFYALRVTATGLKYTGRVTVIGATLTPDGTNAGSIVVKDALTDTGDIKLEFKSPVASSLIFNIPVRFDTGIYVSTYGGTPVSLILYLA